MIDFEGLVNARDVGGMALASGGTTPDRVLIRSETPQLMTKADLVKARNELGIGLVVDLRGNRVRGQDMGGSGPLGDDGRGHIIDFFGLAGGIDLIDPSPDGFLVNLLDRGGKPLEAFLEHFVSTDSAVLVHCHTGKDRTGFVIALTLALAGVSDAEIIADYEKTGPVYEKMMANLVNGDMAVPDTAPAYARHAPSAVAIRSMLTRLRAEWSSAEAWALSKGIDPELIKKTQARLIPDT